MAISVVLSQGIPDAIEQTLAHGVPEEQLEGLRRLLEALHAQGLAGLPQEVREQVLHGFMDASPEALAGISALRGLALVLFYALPARAGATPTGTRSAIPARCRRRRRPSRRPSASR